VRRFGARRRYRGGGRSSRPRHERLRHHGDRHDRFWRGRQRLRGGRDGGNRLHAGALVIAGLAVGLRAADLATLALLAGVVVAGTTAATGAGTLVIADLAVGLRAADLATLALRAGAFLVRFAAIVLADFFVVFLAAAAFLVFFVFFAIIVFPDRCG
jgi:hypothetical protein